jgi:hypothetical protein
MYGSTKNNNEMYFAAKPAIETAGILLQRAMSFYQILASNAYIDKIRKMWRAYYGAYADDVGYGHQVSYTGEQGELVVLPVNHFSNIAKHIFTMITASRPIMEARAINTDYKSLSQTYLANGILDYYMREKGLEKAIADATEMAVVLGSGFVKMEWNATAGEAYDVDPDTGEFNYQGDVEFNTLSPLDVVVDGTKENWNANEWILVRTFQNRFNLIAKYPELANKIKAMPPKTEASIYRLAVFSNDDTDDIPVYEFYHKRTEAMPEGRYLLFVNSDIVLLDTKIPYRQLPIFRITPATILGTPYGYTPMFDVFPLQEAANALYSAIMTNNNAFAVQNIYVPRGADISFEQIEGAMNIIEGNAKPEPLNLTQTPTETYNFLQMIIRDMETISGVNSVTRGNPEASLKSGTALALVQSMALQFISGLQRSYVQLIEEMGTALINNLKDFASAPRVVAIVGKNNKPFLKEFIGEDLNSINRVIVDIGNPLSRTTAGRVQMAEQLLQMKLLKNPEQYFQIMNTGKLDSGFEGEMNELLLIKAENERFLDGQSTIVSPLDSHRMHINEHKAVLADPDLRSNPQLVQIVVDHVNEHLQALRTTDPDLLNLIGEQPLAPPGGSPATGAAPGGPGGQAPNGPPPPQQPPQRPLQHSPMQGMMQPPLQAQMKSTQGSATGGQAQTLPNIPHPPGQFANLPTNPANMIPK